MTYRAKEAIQESDVVIGYNTYVDIVRPLLTRQEIVRTGMTEEVSRAQEAVRQAYFGKKVAVISSGDAGVYGMAGLVYEVLIERGWKPSAGPVVEVIPGASALNSCASLVGAPLMHDFVSISLSDHLTPWPLIAKRVELAAQGDFIIALYNPRSGRRTRQIIETQRILLNYRQPSTPVALVKSAYRENQRIALTNLAEMLEHEIGMLTTVIIGNASTFVYEGLMITPRGYQRKYTLDKETLIKPADRLKTESWSLEGMEGKTAGKYRWDEMDEEERRRLARHPLSRSQAETIQMEPACPAAAIAAEEAASAVKTGLPGQAPSPAKTTIAELLETQEIFELMVAPGVANKQFTPDQMKLLAEVVSAKGIMVYTPDHAMKLIIPDGNPEEAVERLTQAGLMVYPTGEVVRVLACDFCDGEKSEAIPYAEELDRRIGGLTVPKELKIGFNGCAMACYGAVVRDIGLVFRKGYFEIYLGGKMNGRNAHPAQKVAEHVTPQQMVDMVEAIVREYAQNAQPDERFHKYFKRAGAAKFKWDPERDATQIEDLICGGD
jgi:precorrin-3B C17-methyltransferase